MTIRAALIPLLCVGLLYANDQRSSGPVQTPARAEVVDVAAACLLCFWNSAVDTHGWNEDSEVFCDSPEEQQVNSCHKCDEAHATHCAQGGTWSGECSPHCVESLAALDQLETVQEIVARKSMSDLIRVSSDPAIEFNLERGVVQLLGCGQRVVAQVPLAPEDVASLSTLLVLE
jgi:hypothetical protein